MGSNSHPEKNLKHLRVVLDSYLSFYLVQDESFQIWPFSPGSGFPTYFFM